MSKKNQKNKHQIEASAVDPRQVELPVVAPAASAEEPKQEKWEELSDGDKAMIENEMASQKADELVEQAAAAAAKAAEEKAKEEAAALRAEAEEEPKQANRTHVLVRSFVNMPYDHEAALVAGELHNLPIEMYDRLKADARGPFFEEV